MAIATPGPMIKSIHGRIGSLVFYYRNGRQCVRVHVMPRNPDTEAQRIVRRAFGDAVKSWQAMTDDQRYVFNRRTRYMNMSGYNLYISEYMITKISGRTGTGMSPLISAHALTSAFSNPLTSVSPSNTKESHTNVNSTHSKLHPG